MTVQNDLGIAVASSRLRIEGACEQAIDLGAIDDGRASTVAVRCTQQPLQTAIAVEYTLPSAFAGDPPRRAEGTLIVS